MTRRDNLRHSLDQRLDDFVTQYYDEWNTKLLPENFYTWRAQMQFHCAKYLRIAESEARLLIPGARRRYLEASIAKYRVEIGQQ